MITEQLKEKSFVNILCPIKLVNPSHSVNYDGTTIHIYYANKGEGLPRHDHKYTHLLACVNGSLVVRKEGIEVIMNKDSTPVNLKELEWHEFEALEDNTVMVTAFAKGRY